MEEEPVDELFTNWLIYGYIKEREIMESKKANGSSKH